MGAHETQRGSDRRLSDVLVAMPDLNLDACRELSSLSIHTTGEFLFYCSTGSGRTSVAMAASLRPEQVEDCRIAAELLLVPDMEASWVPLLRAAGVDSLGDLACRHPTTLTELLSRLYRQPSIGQTPNKEQGEAGAGTVGFFEVAAWVAYAAAVVAGDQNS